MNTPLPPLYPLRVPTGWLVHWHELRMIDPQKLPDDDPEWDLLEQDLLQIEQEATGLVLDVGWYPDASPTGNFKLVIIQGTDWAAPLVLFRTRSLDELVTHIEENLANPPFVEPLPAVVEPTLASLAATLEHDPDDHESVRAAALLAERNDAVPVLVAHLADPRPRVRYAVVDALRRIGDPAAGPLLLARFLLPETDLDTRRLLIRALGAVRHTPAIPILTRWLQNPDSQQRAAAAWALGTMEAVEALPDVTKAYATERNPPAREEMRTALYRLARAQR